MGRFCFYCGKKLDLGEACDCRYAKKMQAEMDNSDKNKTSSSNFDESTSTSSSSNSTSKSQYTNSSKSGSSTADSHANGENSRQKSENDKQRRWKFRKKSQEKQTTKNQASNAEYEKTSNNNSESSKKNKTAGERVRAFQQSREEFLRNRRSKNNSDGIDFNNIFTRKNSEKNADFTSRNFSIGRFLKNLFTSPSQTISDSQYSGWFNIIFTYLFHACIAAFSILLFVKNSNLTQLIMIRNVGRSFELLKKFSTGVFVRAFIAAIFVSLLRVIVGYLALKIFNRQNIKFVDSLRIFLAGTYYEIVFLILSLVFMNSVGLQALIIIVAASAVRLIIDTMSISHSVILGNDRLLFTSMIISAIIFIIMSYAINFTIPSLANFGIAPDNTFQRNSPAPNMVIELSLEDL